MKKLLLIGASLAICSLSFAQRPLEMLHKSDDKVNSSLRALLENLPAGFTYVNRKAAANDESITFIGAGAKNVGFHHAGAIELPAQAGQVIRKIAFFTPTTDKYGKIFVASRTTSGRFGGYDLDLVESIETVEGMNTHEFKTPLTTEKGLVYVVGYEVKSSAPSGEDDKKKSYPFTLVKQENSSKEGCALALMKDGSAIVGQKGDRIRFVDGRAKLGGVLVIIVQGDNLARTFDVASEFVPTVYSQEGRILIQGAVDSFVVFDAAGRLVAQNSDTVLPKGTYVVKARNGQMDSVTKVTVQ